MGISSDYLITNRYTNQSRDYWFYGASVSINPNNTFQCSLNYRNNVPLEETYKTNSLFNVNLQYKVNARNALSLIANYSLPSNTQERDSYVSLKYDIKLDVPINKNKNLGQLKGQIKSADNKNVSGVIVNLNEIATVTNKKGEFEFRDLAPEKYYLTLDQQTYDRNYISRATLPLIVEITPKKTDTLSIELIKPISIKGTVTYQEIKQIQSTGFKNKLPQLIIKLENGVDQYFTLVNEKGEYNFNEIRPGNWRLSIITKGLENKFEFINNNRTLNLISGINEISNFIVKDKSRKVNIKESTIKLKVTN